jgi:hypothetical protein
MASLQFRTIERNLRRQFWQDLIELQMVEARKRRFRASLVFDPLNPPPIEPMVPVVAELHAKLRTDVE